MKGRNKRNETKRHPPVLLAGPILCSVCGKGDGRRCSKDHKANSCPPPAAAAADSTPLPDPLTPPQQLGKKRARRHDDDEDDDSRSDEPGWNVTTEMKERVRRSAWLREELRDGGLRSMIERIDAASDEEDDDEDGGGGNRRRRRRVGGGGGIDEYSSISPRELALARNRHANAKFARFIDRMLLAAGVLLPGSAPGNDDRDDRHDGHHLVLAPVPRIAARRDDDDSRDNDHGGSDDDEDTSDDCDEDSDSSASGEDEGRREVS
ncbi:hypothetical protein ACHAW5_002090 [Stephanodiscus triporus]|uniref:Uncharacterized protein n=1 Tax=Stephanodiscus triporus TaxID=2934178 RepID=A0ABD3NGM1_9STRA